MPRRKHKERKSAVDEVLTSSRLIREAEMWHRCGFTCEELRLVEYEGYGLQIRPMTPDELKSMRSADKWQ